MPPKTPKTPSYPPWGKIDYALRLRFFLSFILAFLPFIHSFLSFCLSSFLPQGRSLYLASPLQGEERGSYPLFLFRVGYNKEKNWPKINSVSVGPEQASG